MPKVISGAIKIILIILALLKKRLGKTNAKASLSQS